MEAPHLENKWQSRARKVQSTVNQAWFVGYCAPAFLCGSAFGLVWILTARSLSIGAEGILIPVVCMLVLSFIIAYLLVRENFISRAQALELLDEKCRMQNRISSALDGVLPWPNTPQGIERVVVVNYWKPFLQVCVGVLLLILGAVVSPFKSDEVNVTSPTVKPLSLSKVEHLVEQLSEQQLLAPETLKEMQSKISELSKKSLHEQYEHHALEAADSLQESLQREVSQLAQKLDQATREAKNVEREIRNGNKSDAQAHQKEFQRLAQDLLSGGATPNESLKKALRQSLENESKLLSPEASEALRHEMQSLKEKLKSAQEQASKKGAPSDQSSGGRKPGNSSSNSAGPNQGEDSLGEAGISRGGEHSVSVDVEKPPQLTSARVESLAKAPEPSGTPGELVGLSSQRPDIGTPLPIGNGGTTALDAEGGKALERQNLTPEESELVGRLYK
jgi:hypothetical protein